MGLHGEVLAPGGLDGDVCVQAGPVEIEEGFAQAGEVPWPVVVVLSWIHCLQTYLFF